MEDTGFEIEETAPAKAKPSPWEWLPVAALPILALFWVFAAPETLAHRFSLFLGLGLLPGVLWRLAGRNSWNVHRVGFAASLVAFVLTNPNLRPDAGTWEKMIDGWKLVGIGLVISFTQPLWGMLRTQRLLTDSGVVISRYDSLKLCMSGTFFSIFLPGANGGDAYRVYAITKGYRAKLGPAIASITLDRLLGLPSLILVVIMGMAMDYQFFLSNRILSKMIPFISGAGAVCLILVLYLAHAGKSRRRHDWTKPYESRDGGEPGLLKRIHVMIATNVKRPATLPLALLYGFLSHVACIASCQCFGMALGVQGVPAFRYYLIVPMAMAINGIPGAPGGVGQGEVAMATLLDMASPGYDNAQAGVMIMLLFRLSNMAIGLLGGAFYALGKMDFSGIGHISQGVTRIFGGGGRAGLAQPLSKDFAERYEQVKRDSERVLLPVEGAPEDGDGGNGSERWP